MGKDALTVLEEVAEKELISIDCEIKCLHAFREIIRSSAGIPLAWDDPRKS